MGEVKRANKYQLLVLPGWRITRGRWWCLLTSTRQMGTTHWSNGKTADLVTTLQRLEASLFLFILFFSKPCFRRDLVRLRFPWMLLIPLSTFFYCFRFGPNTAPSLLFITMIEIQFRLTATTMPITVSARHNRRILRSAKHQILKSFERQMTKINLLVLLKYTTSDGVYNFIYGNYKKEKEKCALDTWCTYFKYAFRSVSKTLCSMARQHMTIQKTKN